MFINSLLLRRELHQVDLLRLQDEQLRDGAFLGRLGQVKVRELLGDGSGRPRRLRQTIGKDLLLQDGVSPGQLEVREPLGGGGGLVLRDGDRHGFPR